VRTAGTAWSIGIGEFKVTADQHDTLIAHGLGSCIALCLWDSRSLTAGMAHVLLPTPAGHPAAHMPAKFADHAVDHLLGDFRRHGIGAERLIAKIAGGAQMFGGIGQHDVLSIGKRNAERIRELLVKQRILLTAEDVGGRVGRTVMLSPRTGSLLIRTIGSGDRTI
jgi:chemotaxis protein CheD